MTGVVWAWCPNLDTIPKPLVLRHVKDFPRMETLQMTNFLNCLEYTVLIESIDW